MSFILVPASVGPLNIITLTGATLTNFIVGTPYTFTLTAWDQFTTYNVSTNNGSASINTSTGVVTWTPASSGPTGGTASLTIGKRTLSLTLAPTYSVEYWIMSGGGAGDKPQGAGGGAGFRSTGTANLLSGTTYTVTVGGGGGTSSFAGVTQAAGSSGSRPNGGNSPSGFTGGTGTLSGNPCSGGGAGAGGNGQNAQIPPPFPGAVGGNGGVGVTEVWQGQTISYGGGGGGSGYYGSGSGGLPGGGAGSRGGGGGNGGANLGAGGGGEYTAGASIGLGGSGRAYVAYPTTYPAPTLTGTYTTTTFGSLTIVYWTASGSIRFV